MKKTFSKIVTCLIVIGVLFVSTPFLIKTKASTENYYFVGEYKTTKYSSSDGSQYDLNVYEYLDYDNNRIKVVFDVLSLDDNIGDYSDFYIRITRTQVYSQTQYSEHLIRDGNASEMIIVGTEGNVEYFTDGMRITYIIDCNLTSLYIAHCVYDNYEDDTDISYYSVLWLGYAIPYYEYVIDGYYLDGYQQGQTDTISNTDPTTLISRFGDGVGSILSIPIFGQLTLGTLVFIPLSMAVLLLLLKIWRRN